MKRLIQLHVGLFQYLRAELKKTRNLQQLIKFVKDLMKRYLTVMLQEYKNVFLQLDPIYTKQKKEYEKYQKVQQDLRRCVKMLEYIDDKLEKQGRNRTECRQFWADFIKYKNVRKEVFDMLMQEIG